MRRLLQFIVALSIVVYAGGSSLVASEADELRHQAQALKKEAASLAEQGRHDAAEEHARQAMKLLEEAERHEAAAARGDAAGERRPELERAMAEMAEHRERIQNLAQQREKIQASGGPREEVERLTDVIAAAKQQLQAMELKYRDFAAAVHNQRESHPDVRRKLDEAGRRIKHLRVAAENLRAAGADDLAHDLAEKAEALEREARAAKEQLASRTLERREQPHAEMGELHQQIRELREAVEQLRAEVKELRGHVQAIGRDK